MEVNLFATLKRAAQLGQTSWEQATQFLHSQTRFVSETISGLSLFGSTESLADPSQQAFDEKHYFLVPDRLSPTRHSIYSMRCLPEGVPPINDLPKRRILHLPAADAVEVFEQLMTEDIRESRSDSSDTGLGGRLNNLADQIDQLDDRVFHGLLLLGSLVALVNPVAGAVIAAKSLIPSGAMLLSKFGLRTAGESLTKRKLRSEIRRAEKEVLRQFRSAEASSIVNPVLRQLEHALDTDRSEFIPLYDVEFHDSDFGQHDMQRMLTLSYRAVSNVYRQTLDDRRLWKQACLGPEDIDWLRSIRELANASQGEG